MRIALVVLGMHRSGTSALCRVLSLAGATLPRRLLAPLEENEKGFWEPAEIVAAHEEILRSAGSRWDDVLESPTPWCQSPMAEPAIARMEELVRSNYGDSPLIVLKDPRICRLMPLWLKVLERLEARPCCVLPIRNPLEVAASLKKRNGFTISKSTLLWLRHVLDAERDSRGLARSFLRFESLLEDPRRALAKISADLGLAWPRASYRADLEIEEFVAENLRHHRHGAGELQAHSQVSAWVKRAFDALVEGLDGDEEVMRDRLDAIRQEFSGAERAFGPVLVDAERTIERLESRAAEAELLAGRVDPLERRVADLEAMALAAERRAAEQEARAEREIERLAGQVAAVEARARQSIEAESARRDRRIEELLTEVGSLRLARDALAMRIEGIMGSYGWKLLRVLRRVDRALAPPGSRRNRASRHGLRVLAILWREGPSGLVRRAARRASRPDLQAAPIEPGVPAMERHAALAAAGPTTPGCCRECRVAGE
jgi:hypothetical protein